MKSLSKYELHHFITPNTRYFFKRFNISTTFMQKDPEEWKRDNYLINFLKSIWPPKEC